jgi:predicted nucleic acid-binding protein
MRYRLYLDTSVLGAVCDPRPVDRLKATLRLFQRAERKELAVYISTLAIEELSAAPEEVQVKVRAVIESVRPEILIETDESQELADYYVETAVFLERCSIDARHVAIATVYALDALVSWNYRHMVNLQKRQQISGANLMHGFKPIDIVTPGEVTEDA